MFKSLALAAALATAAIAALAQQETSPAAAPAASSSAPAKKRLHPLKLRKGAQAASSPLAAPFKEGGQ